MLYGRAIDSTIETTQGAAMDWSTSTAALMPGLDGVVLRQLFLVDAPQSAADVHRRAGSGSLNGVRYALDRFAEQGLVEVTKVGNTFGYALNPDHLVYPALAAALDMLDPWGDLVRRLQDLVEERMASATATAWVSLSVYGSVARREAGTGSDVDLLLVTPEGATVGSWLDGLVDALHRSVPRWTGNEAHVYRMTDLSLARAVRDADPIVASWTDEAITVVGRDVRALLTASA
jgi:predicted nucleotidyltransferase